MAITAAYAEPRTNPANPGRSDPASDDGEHLIKLNSSSVRPPSRATTSRWRDTCHIIGVQSPAQPWQAGQVMQSDTPSDADPTAERNVAVATASVLMCSRPRQPEKPRDRCQELCDRLFGISPLMLLA